MIPSFASLAVLLAYFGWFECLTTASAFAPGSDFVYHSCVLLILLVRLQPGGHFYCPREGGKLARVWPMVFGAISLPILWEDHPAIVNFAANSGFYEFTALIFRFEHVIPNISSRPDISLRLPQSERYWKRALGYI